MIAHNFVTAVTRNLIYDLLKASFITKNRIFEEFFLLYFNRERNHTQNTKITRVNNFALFR